MRLSWPLIILFEVIFSQTDYTSNSISLSTKRESWLKKFIYDLIKSKPSINIRQGYLDNPAYQEAYDCRQTMTKCIKDLILETNRNKTTGTIKKVEAQFECNIYMKNISVSKLLSKEKEYVTTIWKNAQQGYKNMCYQYQNNKKYIKIQASCKSNSDKKPVHH